MNYYNNKICYFNFESFNKLCEEEKEYIYANGKAIHNKHDISIRSILTDKKEAANFINDAFELNNTKDEIKPENIELYTNRFITQNFLDKETDVIYKIKDKDIFFLIEHQSTIDYNMPRRIIEYKIEIIMQYIDDSKKKMKNYIY